MDPAPVAMPGATPVARAEDEYFLRYRWDWFPVVDEGGRFLGLVRQEAVAGAVAAGQGERPVGEIGTACESPALGPVALAIVRREAEPGDTLSVGTNAITAEVVDLPFSRG